MMKKIFLYFYSMSCLLFCNMEAFACEVAAEVKVLEGRSFNHGLSPVREKSLSFSRDTVSPRQTSKASTTTLSPVRDESDKERAKEDGPTSSTPVSPNGGRNPPIGRAFLHDHVSSPPICGECIKGGASALSTLSSIESTRVLGETSLPLVKPNDVKESQVEATLSTSRAVAETVEGERGSLALKDAILPRGSALMGLQQIIDRCVMEHNPKVYPARARAVLIGRLITYMINTDLLNDDASEALMADAYPANKDFMRGIACLVSAQTVRKDYDQRRMDSKLKDAREDPRNKSYSPDQIRTSVIKFFVEKIIDIEKLKEFLPEEKVGAIISQTAAAASAAEGRIADIAYFAEENIAAALGAIHEEDGATSSTASAERRVETALTKTRDRDVIISPLLAIMVKREIALAAIRAGLRGFEITPELIRNPRELREGLVQSLSRSTICFPLKRLIVEGAVVERSLEGLDNSVVLGHSNPILIRPEAGRVVFFEIPDKDDLAQLKHIPGMPQEEGDNGIKWGKFVRAFNEIDQYKPIEVIRLIQLRDYFDDMLWGNIRRERSLKRLLDFYNDPSKRFADLHREITTGGQTVYSELTRSRMFAGVLKGQYVDNLNVNISIFQALTIANTLHQLCRPGGQDIEVISRRLDFCLLDLEDQLETMSYIFWDWNDPLKVIARDRRDEQILIVSTGNKKSKRSNQAFGAWVDRSENNVRNPALTGRSADGERAAAPRQIAGSAGSASGASSSVAASIQQPKKGFFSRLFGKR